MFSNQKKEASCENGILHNHCSDNVEPISKNNSAFALHCPLLDGSTVFFLSVSKGKTPAIKSHHLNEVTCENGILHNHCTLPVEQVHTFSWAYAHFTWYIYIYIYIHCTHQHMHVLIEHVHVSFEHVHITFEHVHTPVEHTHAFRWACARLTPTHQHTHTSVEDVHA